MMTPTWNKELSKSPTKNVLLEGRLRSADEISRSRLDNLNAPVIANKSLVQPISRLWGSSEQSELAWIYERRGRNDRRHHRYEFGRCVPTWTEKRVLQMRQVSFGNKPTFPVLRSLKASRSVKRPRTTLVYQARIHTK